MPSSVLSPNRPLCKSLSDCATLLKPDVDKASSTAPSAGMKTNGSNDGEFIPPWKKELLLRKSPLARTVEPNLSL